MKQIPIHPMQCPRCSYDVAGEVARWNDASSRELSCPLCGTCPECGLQFEWKYLFDPSLAAPKWLFESGERYRVRSLIRTWVHSLFPWYFWKRVRMEVGGVPKRLWMYAIVLLMLPCLLHLCVTLASSFANTWFTAKTLGFTSKPWGAESRWVSINTGNLPQVFAPYFAQISSYNWLGHSPIPWPFAALALMVSFPLMLLLLPTTLGMVKVRRSHIARAAVYGIAPLTFMLALTVIIAFLMSAGKATQIALARAPGQQARWIESWMQEVSACYPLYRGVYYRLGNLPEHVYHWLIIAWYLVYWYCVLAIGWRIDQKERHRIYLAITIPALLACVWAMLMVPGFGRAIF